jgi:hypothetical protein
VAGLIKEGSRRIIRSATPPPPAAENWPRAEKFSGPLVRVRVPVGEAGASFALEPGVVMDLPRQLAEPRLKDGRDGVLDRDRSCG